MNYFNIDSPAIKFRIIAQNNLAFTLLNYQPIVPGHLLICPIRPVATYDELTHEEVASIMILKKTVCKALIKTFGADGFNFAWNEGSDAGQTVPHFHLHVLPRKKGDMGIIEYEPRQFLYRTGSRAITPDEELKEVVTLIQNNLIL
jgi:diadenosine tetraphosphate (Ap4A) HIT family hydrolase